MERSKRSALPRIFGALIFWAASETGATCTGVSPTWTATPDPVSVNSCISKASDGDTIVLTAGMADWSGGGVTLNKALKIVGQGKGCPESCDDATMLQVGTAVAFAATASNWRISGLTFAGAANSGGSIFINAGGSASATNWRVDHCHFTGATGRGISVGAYASTAGYGPDFPGVIDSNRFSAPLRFKAVEVYGGSLTAHGSWDETLALGGASFVFIEDNYFVHGSMPDGVSSIDGDTGARFVIRFNTFVNGDLSAHGQETCTTISGEPVCAWRSTHGWEIYNNRFDYTAAHSFTINIRGGTGVIHDNDFSGIAGAFLPIRYLYERGDIVRTCLSTGACQGSNPYDGNQPEKFGYMCWQQIGATGSNGITSMPVYQWANSLNGTASEPSLTQITFEPGCGYQHVQLGRDVIPLGPEASGPNAARPTSCATGSAYWATDWGEWNTRTQGPDGQLYRCTAPNTWTPHYTPHPYPHPLRMNSAPAAPAHLVVH